MGKKSADNFLFFSTFHFFFYQSLILYHMDAQDITNNPSPPEDVVMNDEEAVGALTLEKTVEINTKAPFRECLNEFLVLSSKNDEESLAAL
ncbi:hypothetical protein [Absidia glauca]|uniref:Uncharacterized protein n=1 Tax=Absidia glauca TaxID=4829 RepID=A0A168M049_ABSGL|nr:hypothetical protein [Absidia glauca]